MSRAGESTTAAAGTASVRGWVRRHRRAVLGTGLGLAFVVLGTASFMAGSASGEVPVAAPTPTSTPTPTAPPARPTPAAAPAPIALRTCSVQTLASDPRLRTFEGTVLDASTGEVYFDRDGGTPARTGSVLKVLTSAAALAELGPDARLTTSVVQGPGSGDIVLVGGGDPTLTRLGDGQQSVYEGAPTLEDLAARTLAAWRSAHPGQPITSLTLDATEWSTADAWDASWARSEQTTGYHSEVTALQVDGDRADPTRETSPRSTDPVGRAGGFFRDALYAADSSGQTVSPALQIVEGQAPAGAAPLAQVQSQPVSVLVSQLLPISDNTLAEMLARTVSKHQGLDGSAASLATAIPKALAGYGIDTTGIAIRDGSGLSALNGVPSAYVAQLMRQVAAGDGNLAIVGDALPIAGQTGTLASRFTGAAASARGHVRAKTGWIDTAYTLAGYVDAADGKRLTFAFYAIGDGISADAKQALDALTAGVYGCGSNLSDY